MMVGVTETAETVVVIPPLLLDRDQVAEMLSVSVRQVDMLGRAGALTRVYLPGMRTARYDRREVRRLVNQQLKEARSG